MSKIMTLLALSLLPATSAWAQASPPLPVAGEIYELTKSYTTSSQTNDRSSGSSSGRDTILERVIAVRATGIELEYDLSTDVNAGARTRNWQFPARVLRASNGPMQLLNATELEARLEGFLKAAGRDRSICDRWIFTWNAFRIDCDPQSIIKTLGPLT